MKFWNTDNNIEPQEKNKIIINIWFPKLNGETTAAINFIKAVKLQSNKPSLPIIDNKQVNRVGHVSIQTTERYASWWPDPDNTEQVRLFNVVDAINKSFEEDCLSEGGEPDLIISFYSLDINKIERCYQEIEESDYGYVLAGDKKIVRSVNTPKGQSCCGLVYELLVAGGILKLSRLYMDLTAKWLVITPDNFANMIKNAKENECSKYPETMNYPTVENEYVPVQRNNQYDHDRCTIL